MNLKEFFNKQLTGASGLGASRFKLSLDKEKVYTPHVRMSAVLDLLEDDNTLRSGLNSLVRFILSDISIKSEDEKTAKFLNEWVNKRVTLNNEIYNFVFTLLGCGTAYVQPYYTSRVNGDKILDNIKAVPDPSIIYRNIEADENAKDYWLMQVPPEVRSVDDIKVQFRPVWYIKNSIVRYNHIWCVPFPKNKYEVLTFGHSRTLPFYGWGLLSSAVDNEDIKREIIKNWALQAKYRALGKKIIGFYNTSDDAVSLQELENIKQEFMNLEEEDSLLVNKRFDTTDLSFSGQDNMMESQVEFLRKEAGSSLVPNFMTAFSQDSSMATASEAKIPFGLLLQSIQPQIESFLNDIIIRPLLKNYSFLSDDAHFDLGFPNLYSRDETFNTIMQLYNVRAATFNELRISAGLEPVTNGDVWGEQPPLDRLPTQGQQGQPQQMPKTELKEFKKKEKMFSEAMKEINPKVKMNFAEHFDISVPDTKEKEKRLKESIRKIMGK